MSRMSEMRRRRDSPLFCAASMSSTWDGWRGVSISRSSVPRMPASGVRSSWLMVDTNLR